MRKSLRCSLLTLLIFAFLSQVAGHWVQAETLEEPAAQENETEASDGEAAGRSPAVDLPMTAWYEKGRALLESLNAWRSAQGLEPLILTLDLEDLAVQRALEWKVQPTSERPDGSLLEENGLKELHSLNASDPELLFWRWTTANQDILLDPELRSAGLAAISGPTADRPESWCLVLSPEAGQAARGQRGDGAPLLQSLPLSQDSYRLLVRLRGLQVDGEEALYLSPGSTSSLRYSLTRSADSKEGAELLPDAIVASSSDSEVLIVDRDGRVQARKAGEADLSLRLNALPEMEVRLHVVVSPLLRFEMQAQFLQDDNLQAWQKLQEQYAALPSLQDSLADPSLAQGELDESETRCRVTAALQWNDKLESLALDLAEQLSFFSYEGAAGAEKQGLYPTPLRLYLEERIARTGRSGWTFMRRPAGEDSAFAIPGWARSAGLAKLRLGSEDLSVLVYSEAAGSAETMDWTSIQNRLHHHGTADGDSASGLILYTVNLFSMPDAMELVFLENGEVLDYLSFTDPAQQGLEARGGGYAYRLHAALRRTDASGKTVFAYPASVALAFSIDQPASCGFTEDGSLFLRAPGEANLGLSLVDFEHDRVLAETAIPLSIQLPFPEMATEPAPSESPETSVGLSGESSAADPSTVP